MKHILSYGGGVNSSALFFYLLEKEINLDLVIFADTGEESPETYDAVNRMEIICKEKRIAFARVYRMHDMKKINLYDYYLEKKKVMSFMRRDCTGKFKVAPIRKHIREIFGKKETFVMYIGITFDEFHRCKKSNVKYIEQVYPFVDDKIDRQGNLEILIKNKFKAEKSGCIGCIYNKKQTWIEMLQKNPKEFERHKLLEMSNTRYPNIPISEWKKKFMVDGKLTKSYITLNPNYRLEDLEKQYKTQLTGFIDIEPTCDVSGGCFL